MRAGVKMDNRKLRGSAMTEMVVCLLPYLLVLMGAMMVSSMTMGQQEVIKYATSEIRPGSGELDQDKFFSSLKGTPRFETTSSYEPADEDSFNSSTRVEDSDEPVLPYNSNGDDIARAIDLSGTHLYYDVNAGGFRMGRGQNGNRLVNYGFLEDASNEIYHDGDNIDQEIQQMDLVEAASAALGNWITYYSASAEYGYVLPFRGDLPGESTGGDNEDWRSSEGMLVNRDFGRKFYWPSIDDPFYNEWSSYSDASNNVSALFNVAPADMGSSKFGSSSGFQTDVGVFSSSSSSGINW